jgi:four helix bundle protein
MHDYQVLRDRTFRFAVCIVGFCRDLPRTWEARRIAEQLFDAGTSVAANYRAACRARSRKEFIAKVCIVIEESDECELWCALLKRCGIGTGSLLDKLTAESAELRAIFVTSRNTARVNLARKRAAAHKQE